MKTIVCFGDSNTWGFDPATLGRFPGDVRWTGVLARELGSSYRVIEEGLNGRTTNLDDDIEHHRNGYAYLLPCLESHAPIDLITIMLGTNDLKARFGRNASDIAQAAAMLCTTARRQPVGPGGGSPKVIMIAPPPVTLLTGFDLMFQGSVGKSAQFSDYYRRFADWYNLPFIDAGSLVTCSDLDGIHLDADAHGVLGRAIAAKVSGLLA